MSGKAKKYVDECRDTKNQELDLIDKGVSNLLEIPGLLSKLDQVLNELKDLREELRTKKQFSMNTANCKKRFNIYLRQAFTLCPWLDVKSDKFKREVRACLAMDSQEGNSSAVKELTSFASTKFTELRNQFRRKVLSIKETLQTKDLKELTMSLFSTYCLPQETIISEDRVRTALHVRNFLHKKQYYRAESSEGTVAFWSDFKANWENLEEEIKSRGLERMKEIDRRRTERARVELRHITRLTLTHNKITVVPPNITELANLEHLNFFNNHIKELPSSLNSLMKLKILNLGMNRLSVLPRGFGAFPVLEVLDLTYNNLSEKSLPGNFFCLDTVRALYLGDNDFEVLPPEIGKLKGLQILVLRDNDIVALPKEIGDLPRLRELHVQGNRLTVLPPEIGNLDLVGSKQVFRGENNPWVTPIADQYQVGVSHVFDYIRSDTYRFLYGRHIAAEAPPPPKTLDKSKKISRMG